MRLTTLVVGAVTLACTALAVVAFFKDRRALIKSGMVLLVSQYLISGVFKLVQTRTCDDARHMERVFGDRCWLNVPVLLLAGVWEVAASLIVLGTTLTDRHLLWRSYALVSLAVFTVLATLMFKLDPLKWYGLISNVSVTGGLLVAAAC